MSTILVLPQNKHIGTQTHSVHAHQLQIKINPYARSPPIPHQHPQHHPNLRLIHSEICDVPSLRRIDANRPSHPEQTNQHSLLLHTAHINIPQRYGKHVYLHHAKSVAKRFMHSAQTETGLQVPDCIISLCISYSFVYEDGLFQLAQYLERALVAWKQPHISKKIVFAIISHFVNRKKGKSKESTTHKYDIGDAQQYFDALLDANYMVIVEAHKQSKLIAISPTGTVPKYYKFIS